MNNKVAVLSVLVVSLIIVSSVAVVVINNNPKEEWKTECFTYKTYDNALKDNTEMPVYYSDGFFSHPSTEYNPDLMVFALSLELSCGYDPEDMKDKPTSVLGLLRDMGCGNAMVNEYFTKKPTMTSTAMAIGSKQIGDSTVIFLVLNGARYSSEFASNLMMGLEGDHKGFSISRDDGLEFLRTFISDNGITGKTKILVTGYSRTSAASNLIAAYLSDAIAEGKVHERIGNIDITKESVYGFGFSVPYCAYYDRTSGDPLPTDERYDNIWYTVNPDDVVPRLPPSSYGFARYGHIKSLPVRNDDAATKMLEYIAHYVGEDEVSMYDVSTFKDNPSERIYTLGDMYRGFVNKFFKTLGTREHYAVDMEDDLSLALFTIMSEDDLILDIFVEMGGIIQFVKDLISHYGKGDYYDYFIQFVQPVCDRRGCPESAGAILHSIGYLTEVATEYADGNLLNLLLEPYFISMVSNFNLLGLPHYPFVTLCYLMQESGLYDF